MIATPARTLLFALVILVAFALRLTDLTTIPPGLHLDEAENLQRSWRLTQGYGMLADFGIIPEPFDAYIRAGFQTFVGVSPFTGRLLHGFLGLLATAAVIALARALGWRHPQRDWIALVAGVSLAAFPPFVIIGRAMYAANWIPFTSLMSLTALVWAWRSRRPRYWFISGLFAAWTVTFYLAGIAFPLALAASLLVLLLPGRDRWPGWANLMRLVLAFGVGLLPWLMMFGLVPNWIFARIQGLTVQFNPLADPSTILHQIVTALQPIVIADTVFFPVYNPYTIPYLNPPQIVLLLLGIGVALWRWRERVTLIPLLVFGVMIAPNMLSNAPEQPVRMVGVYAPLCLLVGFGAGELLNRLRQGWGRWLALGGLALLLIVTPLHTRYHVAYHFQQQPRLVDDPVSVYSWAYLFGLGYQDMLLQIAQSDQPVYLPLDQVNTVRAAALLRPSAFPRVLPYDLRSLPDGVLFRPDQQVTYGFPEFDHIPLQYVLALPESGELIILNPLGQAEARELEDRIQSLGQPLLTRQGWRIGSQLALTAAYHPFAQMVRLGNPPLAVFNDELELLSLESDFELRAGEWLPVTLRWRLRQPTGLDYFVRLQLRDFNGENRGTQNDRDGLILRYLFPSVMWLPDRIITETRWVQVYGDAPAGGYRFALSVNRYPGPVGVPVTLTNPSVAADGSWLLVGRGLVNSPAFDPTGQPAQTTDAIYGDVIRLRGYSLEQPVAGVQPGATVTLSLFWEALQPMGEGYTLFVHLIDADGNLIAQQDAQPFEGRYPTWAWQPGRIVQTSHALVVPADGQPAQLAIGWYRQPSFERLATTLDGQPQPDNRIIIR